MSENLICPCKRVKCERYGHCDECRKHHESKKNPVACERESKKERKLKQKQQ